MLRPILVLMMVLFLIPLANAVEGDYEVLGEIFETFELGNIRGIHAIGEVVYTGDFGADNDFDTWNVSDPANIVNIQFTGGPGPSSGLLDIFVRDEVVTPATTRVAYYFVENSLGTQLVLLNQTDHFRDDNFIFLGQVTGHGDFIEVRNQVVYGADGNISTFDVTTKSAPTLIQEIIGQKPAGGMDVSDDGNTMYVSASDGLYIYDVSTPSAITLLSNLTQATGGAPFFLAGGAGVDVVGNTVFYLGGTDNSIVTIDVTDRNNPTFLNANNVSGLSNPKQIDVEDIVAHVTSFGNNGRVVSFNISNPSNIRFIDFEDSAGNSLFNVQSIFVQNNNRIYVATGDGGDEALTILSIDCGTFACSSFSSCQHPQLIQECLAVQSAFCDDNEFLFGGGDISSFDIACTVDDLSPITGAVSGSLPLQGVADISGMAVIIFLTITLFIGLVGVKKLKGK